MAFHSSGLVRFVIRRQSGAARGRLALAAAIALVVVVASAGGALGQYKFMTVAGNWPFTGNASSTTFTSQNNLGTITVTHLSPTNVWGLDDNNNAAIFPSQFTTLFPGTGTVEGHLAQYMYDQPALVSFSLQNYTIKKSLAFGMWNTSSEVAQPAYRLHMIDGNSNVAMPTTWKLIGNQQNTTQVSGAFQLTMNLSNGEISAGAAVGGSVHTNAAFWRNIPGGTQEIVVVSNLGALNTLGDGVGFYFADTPEPASAVCLAIGVAMLGALRRRRK